MESYESGKATSLWLDTSAGTSYPMLSEDMEVDVAIIGGGIAGLTTALLLSRAGKRTVVIESGWILAGVTGFTTAKLTSNHGLIYKQLIDNFGEERASVYADANSAAIQFVTSLIEKENIDCDLQQMPSYTYALTSEDDRKIRDEVYAAATCGLSVKYTEDVPLPFATAGAIKFEGQYVFHPRKYLLSIASFITDAGGVILENTKALKIDEGEDICTITTDKGLVRARDVVVATNYPVYDPKLFFARLTTRQSYVLGVRLESPFPEGMFYSTEESFHSLRPHWWGTDKEIVLIGGEMHPVGQGGDIVERYKRLEDWTREYFSVKSIDYHWTTHDAQSYDHVPLIGKITSSTEHIYVATGLKGWGMTHGTVAGIMLSNEILGNDNPWAKLYNPNRFETFVSGEMLATNVGIVATLIKGKFAKFADSVADMVNGDARVVEIDNDKIAVYRDDLGALHAISAECTHMGCIVNWNNAEKSWDCPCHGSRFSYKGEVIHAPAINELKPYKETVI